MLLIDLTNKLEWMAKTSYSTGDILRDTNIPDGYIATCTTAGISGETEPEWQVGTLTDGTITWNVAVDPNYYEKATKASAQAAAESAAQRVRRLLKPRPHQPVHMLLAHQKARKILNLTQITPVLRRPALQQLLTTPRYQKQMQKLAKRRPQIVQNPHSLARPMQKPLRPMRLSRLKKRLPVQKQRQRMTRQN